MAGQQPLENSTGSAAAPGAFPDDEEEQYSVQPIASDKTAGVHDDPELFAKDQAPHEQTVGVNPLPASGGFGNPIKLAPGEKIPHDATFAANDRERNVRTDAASYEKSDAMPSVETHRQEPAISDPVGPNSRSMIPESSMGMGKDAPEDASKENVGPFTSSVAPESTTNQLAGQVPTEPRREATVVSDNGTNKDESNPGGGVAAMAAGAAATVAAAAGGAVLLASEKIKQTTGTDLKASLPGSVQRTIDESAKDSPTKTDTIDTTTEHGTPSKSHVTSKDHAGIGETASGVPDESRGGVAAMATGAAATVAAAAGGAVLLANEKIKQTTGTDLKASLPGSVQRTIDESAKDSPTKTDTTTGHGTPSKSHATSKDHAGIGETASGVPDEVTQSQQKAHEPPEASANPTAVEEKSAVEKSLLSKVTPTEAQGEPAPTTTATTATTAASSTSASGAPQLGDPTAGVAPIDMGHHTTDSRDVSPKSRAPIKQETAGTPSSQQTHPAVTTGPASSAAPAQSGASSSAPAKRQSFVERMKAGTSSNTSGNGTATESGAQSPISPGKDSTTSKRRSLFGRIKEKMRS